MKKFAFLALALVAVAFTACDKKNGEEEKPTVTIAGNGFDIASTLSYTPATMVNAQVKVDIAASEGIDKMLVEITSTSPVFTAALTALGLNREVDLANPGAELEAALSNLPGGITLPFGSTVKGKKTLQFDISAFVPVMYSLSALQGVTAFTADFKVTVKDALGTNDTKTVKMSFTAQ